MPPEKQESLSAFRFSLAEETLDDARAALAERRYRVAINRSYYSAYYAMYAVLALDAIERNHHSGVISEFRRLYIKSGVFKADLSDLIRELFSNRVKSDYRDYYVPDEDAAVQQVHGAETVVESVKTYLQRRNT